MPIGSHFCDCGKVPAVIAHPTIRFRKNREYLVCTNDNIFNVGKKSSDSGKRVSNLSVKTILHSSARLSIRRPIQLFLYDYTLSYLRVISLVNCTSIFLLFI